MIEREIPKFLVSRRYISVLIAFIVLFSGLFILIYRPFSMAIWFSVSETLNFSFTILFYLGSIVILILSRTLMYTIQNRLDITVMTYIWWIMAENLLISLTYTLITLYFFPFEGISVPLLATRALMCVTMILALPNGLVSFYAAYRSKSEELDAMQYQHQLLEEKFRLLQGRQSELRAAVTPQSRHESTPKMINLHDNNGTLRLTINIDSLYYLESEDNYMKVYYKHNDKIVSYMLRCRTRSIEESLKGTPMTRCHRSFIVNINKIRFIKKEQRMNFIVLDDDSIKRIPVSKSYYDSLIASLNTIEPQQGINNTTSVMLHHEE